MTQENNKIEYCIKFTGKAELPEPLELSEGYKLDVEGEVISMKETDLYNGTHLKTFAFKPIKAELTDKKGKVIKVKDTRSQSQKLRRVILWLWEQNSNEMRDPEDCYEQTMNWIIKDIEFAYKSALEQSLKKV